MLFDTRSMQNAPAMNYEDADMLNFDPSSLLPMTMDDNFQDMFDDQDGSQYMTGPPLDHSMTSYVQPGILSPDPNRGLPPDPSRFSISMDHSNPIEQQEGQEQQLQYLHNQHQQQQHQQRHDQQPRGGQQDLSLQHQQQQQQQELERQQVLGTSSGAGAGPLPTGYGRQASQGLGSTLTEFTKRRNWSQRILEEIRDFLHILNAEGRFIYASPSAESLTGYCNHELAGQFMASFIHPDDRAVYQREFHESIATGNQLRFFYRFKKKDGPYIIFESHGHPHLAPEPHMFGSPSLPSSSMCRGFFMMSRPYPTATSAFLDSFLEHKIENQRLQRRIADMKREEEEDNIAIATKTAALHRFDSIPSRATSETPISETSTSGFLPMSQRSQQAQAANAATVAAAAAGPISMPPPVSSFALTRRNLDEVNQFSRAEGIKDKMARYANGEGSQPDDIDPIEMMTGLRYGEGERAQGVSTGDQNPMLIKGDAGIAIPTDRAMSGGLGIGNAKKKMKIVEEFVCTECGT